MKIKDYIGFKEIELEDFEHFLQKLLGDKDVSELSDNLDENDFEQLFEIMKKLYYD